MKIRIALIGLGFLGSATGVRAVPPTITVTWSDTGTPQQPDDYEITGASGDFPNVELKAESLTWRIYSTDSDNPNSIGDIGTISSPHPQNFGVRIEGNGGAAGARTVKGIVLDPQGTGSDAKYSRITGGSITGDIDGNLSLQRSSGGTGGNLVSFTIQGTVASTCTMTVPVIESLSVSGDFAGQLVLASGIPDGASVGIVGELTGTIDLTEDDLAGALSLGGGDGSVVNVGAFKGTAEMNLGSGDELFSGEVFLETVEPATNGLGIRLEGGLFDGIISVESDMEGLIGAHGGAFLSNAEISIGGNLEGTVYTAQILADPSDTGNMEGQINVMGSMLGEIRVEGDLIGEIHIYDDLDSDGTIVLEKQVANSGSVLIDGACGGEVGISSHCDGSISVGIDLSGAISIGGEASGTITIGWDIESGGMVYVVQGLKDNGAIEVGGLTSGSILIEQQMSEFSVINAVGGLGSGGVIDVNGQGDYTTVTEGTIHVGGDSGNTPYSTVPFAGYIQINCPGSGEFAGLIEVVGCAASANQTATICIRGTDNGTVTFYDSGCTYGYTQDCSFECAAPYHP